MTKVIGTYDDRDMSLQAQDQYFRFVRWVPELSRDEEDQLVQVVERGKLERVKAYPNAQMIAAAAAAVDRLVQGYQGLVIVIANQMKQRFHSMDLMDLVQEGNCGLLRAIEENDPSKGLPLKALACHCIRYAICDAWREYNGFVRCSRRAHHEMVEVLQAEASLMQDAEQEPTVAQLAQATGLSVEQVHEVQAFRCWLRIESLQAYQEEHEERGDAECFCSLFEGSPVSEQRCAAIRQGMQEVLTERQWQVIALRYGLLDGCQQGMTHTEVATHLGVTRDNSAHIEMVAERRLRQHLGGLVGLPVICCLACGKPVPQRVASRPRRYCHNNTCRYAVQKMQQQGVARWMRRCTPHATR